jgi:hypothetical protein
MKYFVKEAEKKEPGYWGRNMAATRAMRASDSGIGVAVANPELAGKRMIEGLKSGAIGGGIGAGAGALIGKLLRKPVVFPALAGGVLGLTAGDFERAVYSREKISKRKRNRLRGFGCERHDSRSQKEISSRKI